MKFPDAVKNHSQTLHSISAKLIISTVAFRKYELILDDALSALARGYVLAILVPLEILISILDGIHLDKMHESNQRTDDLLQIRAHSNDTHYRNGRQRAYQYPGSSRCIELFAFLGRQMDVPQRLKTSFHIHTFWYLSDAKIYWMSRGCHCSALQ